MAHTRKNGADTLAAFAVALSRPLQGDRQQVRGDLDFVQRGKFAEDGDQHTLRGGVSVYKQGDERVKDAVDREYLPRKGRIGIAEWPEAIDDHFEVGGAFIRIYLWILCGCRNQSYKGWGGLRKIGRLGKHAQPARRCKAQRALRRVQDKYSQNICQPFANQRLLLCRYVPEFALKCIDKFM